MAVPETSGSQPSLLDPGAILPGRAPAEFVGSAAVLVDTPVPHLDRTFDYGIPPALAGDVRAGIRVRVRFAGKDRDGLVLAVGPTTAQTTAPLRRVVSPLPVLTPDVLAVAREIAAHYAGTLGDVLRLAIPPRHARTEKSVRAERPESAPAAEPESARPVEPVHPRPAGDPEDLLGHAGAELRSARLARADAAWSTYGGGGALIRRLVAGDAPRAAWCAVPWPRSVPPATQADRADQADRDTPTGPAWAESVAAAAAATVTGGRSALLLVPTATEVDQLAAALSDWELDHVTLTAEAGPAARYRSFLLALTGRVRIVLGTRSAAFAPLADLGLVVCWDDGHDAYSDPRAPYPHARTILTRRAEHSGAAALFGGYARSVEAQELVHSGWARELAAPRAVLRAGTARIVAPDEFDLQREGRPAGPAFPAPPGRWPAAPSSTGPCSCRCRAPATSRSSPARTAGNRRAVRAAPARSPSTGATRPVLPVLLVLPVLV
ncbi:hypothetical protein [Pseudactinotalea sp. HY158]|uniref:primosomal protein N' family DNA-binding protein n=1 Tax=Pseudactinotalea sp. HY158 TaxID=2654547 RepID=UPI00129C872E|nr:hypothetical protein [Pseudactinotalea sp. HY158]QGH69379.1 hypothetical protein GCE65_07515 [Pseudactinotalea sp. HY158]